MSYDSSDLTKRDKNKKVLTEINLNKSIFTQVLYFYLSTLHFATLRTFQKRKKYDAHRHRLYYHQ